MIRVHTPNGTHEIEESWKRDAYGLRGPIGGTQLPSGLVSLRVRYDLLGGIENLEARHYTWRTNAAGGGSGVSGAHVDGDLLDEARTLAEQIIDAVLHEARGAAPRRVRDIVVETTSQPAATLTALLSRAPELTGAELRVSSENAFVVTVDADSPVGAQSVADTLAANGLGGHVYERFAFRTAACGLGRDRELTLAAAPA